MATWKSVISEEWQKRLKARQAGTGAVLPLVEENFSENEVLAAVDVLLSGQITMAEKVRQFEAEFAKAVGAPHAVMVNSGSSANLLAVAVAMNPLRENRLHPGDEVLVPAVCWSTSVWPLLQFGLKPVFVDVDPLTLNMDMQSAARARTERTRAMVAVHILGNCAPMEELLGFCRKHELLLIEDTCESLGSTVHGHLLGTLGDFGTYSFFFSHHMTTGEGGMVVCKTEEDRDLLKCLRAHGWTRELPDRSRLESLHTDVDPRFLFVNVGFNLRPMDLQAAMGIEQLKRLTEMNRARAANSDALQKALLAHPRWKNQFEFPKPTAGAIPSWFGFPFLVRSELQGRLSSFKAHLKKAGIENRPVVSGNFARQPALPIFGVHLKPEDFPGAEEVHRRGVFIGLHSRPLAPSTINHVADCLIAAIEEGGAS